MENLSTVLKHRRKELGLTLAQIAEKMGVTEATVQRWESGNIKSIRYDKIGKLAEILQVNPASFMGWGESIDSLPSNIADRQRAIFSKNLNYYMERTGKTIADLSQDLSFPFSTVSDWVHGKKYPRMDKVQAIADYFGVTKSNLTEENTHLLFANVRNLEPMDKAPLSCQYKKASFISDKAQKVAERYSKLDPHGQEAVDAILDVEYRRCTESASPGEIHMIKAAARSGDVSEIEEIHLDEPPEEEIIPR